MGTSSTATTTSSTNGNGHHFVLSNPFSHNEGDEDGDFRRTNSSTPNPPSTPATTGFWTQLVSRHAYFHVKITVHQLANIPLVSGEYSAQWRFKGVHALPTTKSNNSGLLSAIVKNKQRSHTKAKGKGRDGGGSGKRENEDTDDTGSLNSSENHHGSTSGHSSSSSSTSSGSPSTPLAASAASSLASWASSAPSASTIYPPPNTPARGQTPFIKLKDHNVKWEQTLSTIVRMDIDRDPTSPVLLSTPFKLAIMQRDSSYRSDRSGTHSTTTTKQFGNVTLDLAQYAMKGDVTRQYLLRESKTNATLKLTTTVTHIPHHTTSSALPTPSTSSASTPAPSTPSVSSSLTINPPTPNFVAPPLPSGEILAGISNIKTRGLNLGGEADVYRTRPKGLDLYGPYYDQEELEMDLMGGIRVKGVSPGHQGPRYTHIHNLSTGTHGRARSGSGPSFDPSRLPVAYGAKTTEALIDAIFNPVPTRDKRRESPFTIFVPETPPESAATPGTSTTVSTSGSGSIGGKSPSATEAKFPFSRSDSILPGAVPQATKQKGRTFSKRPQASRAQSTGIGAGLGIMGLGMGLGVGLGAQISITPSSPEGRKSYDNHGRPSLGADPRPSIDSVKSAGAISAGARPSLDVPGRQTSVGGMSVASVEGVKSAGVVQDTGKRWWRPGRSRPGTPVPAA